MSTDGSSHEEPPVSDQNESVKQEAEDAEQTEQGGRLKRLKSGLKVISFYGKWLFDKLIKLLNQVSRDYRAVARQLKNARHDKRLKEMLEQAGSQSRPRERTSSVSAEESEVDGKVSEWMPRTQNE